MPTTAEIISQFNEDHLYMTADCLFVKQLRNKGFYETEIAAVIDVLNNLCPKCFDAPAGCNCWRDD